MPYEEITIVDNWKVTASAGEIENPETTKYYFFYIIPSDSSQLYDIVKGKKEGRIPKILRSRLIYDIRYEGTDFSYLYSWKVRVYMVDCSGNNVKVLDVGDYTKYPHKSGDIDITNLYSCNAPALGIQAVAVAPWPLVSPVVPVPVDATYYITLKHYVSWGW